MIVSKNMICRPCSTRNLQLEQSVELKMQEIVEKQYDFCPNEIAQEDLHKVYLFMAQFHLHKLRKKWELEHPDWDKTESQESDFPRNLRQVFGKPISEEDFRQEREARKKERESAPYPTPIPTRGLLLVGKAGRGKTMLASIISAVLKIHFYTSREIDMAWGMNPQECQDTYSPLFCRYTPVILDDVGSESGTRRYGNEPLLPSLLCNIYDNWRWYGKLVIMTSNLSTYDKEPTDSRTILGSFGNRVESRFSEMFETIRFTGKTDYRKEQRK